MSKGKKLLIILALGGLAYWFVNRSKTQGASKTLEGAAYYSGTQTDVLNSARDAISAARTAVGTAGTINDATRSAVQTAVNYRDAQEARTAASIPNRSSAFRTPSLQDSRDLLNN